MENRKKSIGVLGAFALSVGTSIGWGSFVVTGSNYLSKAGLTGSVIGIMIGEIFKGSPVFRTGGDEFVIILEGENYAKREDLLSRLRILSGGNASSEDGILIAAGLAVREQSESFQDVFHRADKLMYQHKAKLKIKRPNHNLR